MYHQHDNNSNLIELPPERHHRPNLGFSRSSPPVIGLFWPWNLSPWSCLRALGQPQLQIAADRPIEPGEIGLLWWKTGVGAALTRLARVRTSSQTPGLPFREGERQRRYKHMVTDDRNMSARAR